MSADPTEAAAFVHPSALVEDGVELGPGAKIWHQAQVRRDARIGARCVVGKGAFVDFGVSIGADSKLQNYVCVYHGVTLGRGVFVGPHVVFTNDKRPRAVTPRFGLLGDGDWEVGETLVGDGASFGANATVLPGLRIGNWAMIGAAALVTRDVAAYALVVGAPARQVGWVCACGARLSDASAESDSGARTCSQCGELPADHPLRGGAGRPNSA